MDWDEYFLSMAYFVALKSRDESTHVGAVIVGPDNEVRSTGYNDFPRGINDDVPERQEKPEKYYFFAHAERNAIYNAARAGVSVKGCRIYTQGIPCSDCGIAIIQSGIKEIILCSRWNIDNPKRWEESGRRTLKMFKECNIKVRYYNGPLITKISGFKTEKVRELVS